MSLDTKRTMKNVKFLDGSTKPVQVVVSKPGNLYTVHVELTGSIIKKATDLSFTEAQRKYKEFQIIFLGAITSELNHPNEVQ